MEEQTIFGQLMDAIGIAVEEQEAVPVVAERVITATNNGALNPEVARRLRMTQVITKFASTLTLRPIKVAIATPADNNYQEAPAWSDSDNIWFQAKSLHDLSAPSTVLGLKGLSLHEIAHILLTPRTGSNLAKEVQRQDMWRAFNALEDQRIEMMMTKRFGNVADWLSATVAKFIMDEPQQWKLAFPLLHGRKFLPKELRAQVAKLYENPQDVVRIGQLIDQYIVLNLADPSTYGTALAIIAEYNSLVGNLASQPNPKGWGPPIEGWGRIKDPSGHDERKSGEWKSSSSKPMKKADQQKLAAKVQDEVDNDSAPEPGDNMSSNQDGEQCSGDSDAGQYGSGLNEIAENIIKDVLDRKAKDIANTIKQYNGEADLTSIKADTPERLDTSPRNVPAPTVQASKSFANELERLRSDYDPGWNRRVESGKLNIQRYVTGTDIDECFDEWDMGREDAVDIEAVILLDISGSMQANAEGAFQSMWAIKRALDKANASTTVVAFDHESHLLYSSNERATAQMKYSWCRGGTDPYSSLKYTKNVLAQSNRAIKICIVITDGTWGNSDRSDDLLREFRRAGVITALAYIEDGWSRGNNQEVELDSHGCEVAVNIAEMSDLFTLGRQMVKLGIARNLVNAGA